MTSTEYDDEESFGDFTFAPSVVNSIPKNKLTNGSDLSLNNNIDDDWGDFVNSSADLSRSESLHAKSSGSFDKSFDPLSFRVDQHNQNSQNDNSVPATEHDSVPSRIRAHFVKPKGALPLPLSLFGEAEKEEDNEDGSGAAGLLFNGATEVKTNDKKMRSDLNVSDMFSNLYKQSEGANGPKSDSKESSLNLGNLSSHGLILEYNGLDLNRSVSNLESNGLDWNGGVSNSGSNEVDLKRSVSTLDSNGLNWGLDGWEFKGSETKLPAGDLNIKSENAAPVVLKTENGPISNLNGFNLSWNVLGSDLNVSGSNVNGNLDANKSSLLVDDNEDFGDDDGWEFKVAESGTTTGDSYSKVNGKWPDNPVGVKHTFGFGNGAALPTDLFVESDVISQKSGELNFGFDFSQISATTNGISSNSFSDRKQGDNNKNSSNSTPINGNVGNGEIFFKDAFPETGSKDKGDEVELENQKGALPLPFFGDVEHETEDPLTYQDASTSNPASSTRDSTKKSPGPNISINDLISSLYSQAEQNTSVNHMQSPSENHLGSSQKVVDSNSTDGDGDFDDDSWEFKDAFSRTIGENQTSAAVDGESHKKYSTKVKLKDFADFYSRLKDELYIVAHSHLDSLKKARSAAALCGEDDKAKALDNEIQDLYNELYGDRIISKEPHSESHPTSNICFDELVEVLQGPKFHVLESEYHLSKRLSLAEKNWKSAIELLKHVVSISKIITLGSKEEQSNYVSTWFKVVSICAQVLRHGSSIWKQSLEKNVHCQMLSDPRGKQYILALGEIYRAVEVLGSSAKFYKPWLLLSYADTAGVFTLLSECSNLWSSSGLEEAFQSISDPIGLEYNVTPKELLESVKYIHDLDAFALHNQVFSGQEPTCHLSLLTAGTVPGMKMVIWNGERYFLTLANLWANLISIDPPNLPHMHVG